MIGRFVDTGIILFAALIGVWFLIVTISSYFHEYTATLHFNELGEWWADVVVFSIVSLLAIWRSIVWIHRLRYKIGE